MIISGDVKNKTIICSLCGAELTIEDKRCPYCDCDMMAEIFAAEQKADDHKRQLERITEKQKKNKRKTVLIALIPIVIVAIIISIIILKGNMADSDAERENAVFEAYVERLDNEYVKTIEMEKWSTSGEDFYDTNFKTDAGLVWMSNAYIKVPIYEAGNGNSMDGYLLMIKHCYAETDISGTFNEFKVPYWDFNTTVSLINDPKYKKAIDVVEIEDMNYERCENVKCSYYTFECYKKDNVYTYVCDFENGYFLKYEVEIIEDITIKDVSELVKIASIHLEKMESKK